MSQSAAPTVAAPRIRLDKWLWYARIYRTRAVAAEAVRSGRVRVNRDRIQKPGYGLKLGDVLTIARGGRVLVLEVAALGVRRGPAAEAAGLYVDHSDPPPQARPGASSAAS